MSADTGHARTAPDAIHVTFGHYLDTKWPEMCELSWSELIEILTTHEIGPKEGKCIIPATFRGTERKKQDAERIDVAFLDSDSGATLQEIETSIKELGYSAIISSTHSHLTTITKASKSNWQKFSRDNPTDAEVAYLENKGLLPRIAAGGLILPEDDDFVYFQHQPCPKFRVVILLVRPWLAENYASQDKANEAWKERIEALAAALALDHDQSCTDTSRLFYLPRRPSDGPPVETGVVEGAPCDIFSLPSASWKQQKSSGPESIFAGLGGFGSSDEYADADGVIFDLLAWSGRCGNSFLIGKALEARKPSVLTGRIADSVKVHIQCPNSDTHTNPGADNATFVINAGQSQNNKKGFVVHCRHGHCDGRDRLFFIRRMLEAKWLDVADLDAPEFQLPAGAAAVDPVAELVAEFNQRYLVLNENGRAIVYAPGFDPVLRRHRYDRITFEDLRLLYLNRRVQVAADEKGNAILKNAATVWLNHIDRRQYIDGIVFDPTTTESTPGTLNLWRGFAVTPAKGDWSLMKRHVWEVVCDCDPIRYTYLMKWMARLVQRPAEQGEVAVVMKGGEGTGKGTLAKALLYILGQHGLAISNSKHLTGCFNGHLRDAVLLFADEAFFAGDKAHVGVLKSLITEPYLTIEAKFQNAMQMPNFLHVLMASNEDWVVPAALDARRFFVLVVSEARKGDHPYFADIWAQMAAGGYEAMLHDLLAMDISGFNVRAVPITAGLQEQKKLSLPLPEAWWLDVLHRGYVYQSKLGLEAHFSEWHDTMATDLLYASYTAYADRAHDRHPLSRETFGKFLTRMGCKPYRGNMIIGEHVADVNNAFGGTSRKAKTVEKERACGYRLGPLEEARAAFKKDTGMTADWPSDEE